MMKPLLLALKVCFRKHSRKKMIKTVLFLFLRSIIYSGLLPWTRAACNKVFFSHFRWYLLGVKYSLNHAHLGLFLRINSYFLTCPWDFDLTYLSLNSSLMLVKILHHHYCLMPFGGKWYFSMRHEIVSYAQLLVRQTGTRVSFTLIKLVTNNCNILCL